MIPTSTIGRVVLALVALVVLIVAVPTVWLQVQSMRSSALLHARMADWESVADAGIHIGATQSDVKSWLERRVYHHAIPAFDSRFYPYRFPVEDVPVLGLKLPCADYELSIEVEFDPHDRVYQRRVTTMGGACL